jgi:hypothetical protein
MPLDEETQRLLDIYAYIKAARDLCEIDAVSRRGARGDAEVMAIVKGMADDWETFWEAFRTKWGIPDHPLRGEIPEGILTRRREEPACS